MSVDGDEMAHITDSDRHEGEGSGIDVQLQCHFGWAVGNHMVEISGMDVGVWDKWQCPGRNKKALANV